METFVRAQVLRPRRVRQQLRDNAASGIAFRLMGGRRHPELHLITRLDSHPHDPCQRFADTLTSINA